MVEIQANNSWTDVLRTYFRYNFIYNTYVHTWYVLHTIMSLISQQLRVRKFYKYHFCILMRCHG
jgi:hypothetical protein